MTWKRRHEPSDDSPSITNGRWIIWFDVTDTDGNPILVYSSCDEFGEPDHVTCDDFCGGIEALKAELEKVAS